MSKCVVSVKSKVKKKSDLDELIESFMAMSQRQRSKIETIAKEKNGTFIGAAVSQTLKKQYSPHRKPRSPKKQHSPQRKALAPKKQASEIQYIPQIKDLGNGIRTIILKRVKNTNT